jgi:hypothetical protein
MYVVSDFNYGDICVIGHYARNRLELRWGFKSFGTRRCVSWWVISDVSNDRGAFIVKGQAVQKDLYSRDSVLFYTASLNS